MVSRAFSYPIPVVGWGSDIEGEVRPFQFEPVIHGPVLLVKISGLEVTNPSVATLLDVEQLGWCVRAHCKTTYFRKSWIFHTPQTQIEIPLEQVAHTVDFSLEVVATKNIDRYAPRGVHEDFAGATFKLNAGDIVAIGPANQLFVDLAFDPLKGEVSSIMIVDQSPTRETGPFEVSFEGPKIMILIPKLDWEAYKQVKNTSPTLIHSGVVLPTLVEAISLVRDSSRGGHLTEHLWFQRIQAWLSSMGLDPDDPLETAQKLLQNPMTRLLHDAIKNMGDEG
jgi:hypothetical protein